MKVIAITEFNEPYHGRKYPKKLLVEVDFEELTLLHGTEIKDREEIKIGHVIKVSKLWKSMETLRRLFNSREDVTKRLREICDELDAVELPNILENKDK